MIHFSQIIAEGLETPFDLILPPGMSAAVITPCERESNIIIRLVTGMLQPLAGSLMVNDVTPDELKDSQLPVFRRNIGILYSDGGMLSNLNIWENLTLQLSYDGECHTTELETRSSKALQLVGFDGPLGILPSRLTLFQRRLIAFARIYLAEPALVVYQSLLDGLSRSEQMQLRRLAHEYQQQDSMRTSLFLTSSLDSLKGIEFDFVYNRGGTSQT